MKSAINGENGERWNQSLTKRVRFTLGDADSMAIRRANTPVKAIFRGNAVQAVTEENAALMAWRPTDILGMLQETAIARLTRGKRVSAVGDCGAYRIVSPMNTRNSCMAGVTNFTKKYHGARQIIFKSEWGSAYET